MSRVGRALIPISSGVQVESREQNIFVSGVKGKFELQVPEDLECVIEEKTLTLKSRGDGPGVGRMWGTFRSLLRNALEGVEKGFRVQLELKGVGYKAAVQGQNLNLSLGFSHMVNLDVPEGLTVSVKGLVIEIEGIDKQKVGQFAAWVQSYRPPEPYKGKGIHNLQKPSLLRKEGKKK